MRRRTIVGIGLAVLLAVSGSWWWLFGRQDTTEELRTVTAERSRVVQDVSFTGRLEAREEATLGFEGGGTVRDVLVNLGDSVEVGAPLVRLDNRVASADFAAAQAVLAAAIDQKRLAADAAERLQQRTATEMRAALEQQRQAVRGAKAELDQQKAVFEHVDQESGDSSTRDAALLAVQVKTSAYQAAQRALSVLEAAVSKSNTAAADDAAAAQAAYAATVQQSRKVAGLSALAGGQQAAAVRLAQTVLTAPFDGTVTMLEATVGDVAVPGAAVAAVATTDDLVLTADLSETDAVKLAVGMSSTIMFDAFGSSEQWTAEVVSIAPAAKIIEGVPTFETQLQLLAADNRFKPGLTANITVHAAARDGVIAIPRRAVVTQDGRSFVRVLTGGEVQEVPVTEGLLGTDGRVEITSGLSGGEAVVLQAPAGGS